MPNWFISLVSDIKFINDTTALDQICKWDFYCAYHIIVLVGFLICFTSSLHTCNRSIVIKQYDFKWFLLEVSDKFGIKLNLIVSSVFKHWVVP